MRLAKQIIAPTTTQVVQTCNVEIGSQKQVYGSEATQVERGKVLANILSINEVSAMCESSKLSKVGIWMANSYIEKID